MAALRRVPSFTNYNPQGLRVLLVESDRKSRHAADAQLKQCSYTVTCSSSCLEALAQLGSSSGTSAGFDVLLVASSTLQAKAQDASKLMKQVKQLHMPFILMAECSSKPDEVMLGIKLGADDILEKPLCPLKLKNIWQHTVRRMMRSSSAKDADLMMLDHAGHNQASCSSESGSPRRNNAAAATACHLLTDSPPAASSPVHPSSWGAAAEAASTPVLGLIHSSAASTFGSPARSGDAAAAAAQGQQGSDSTAERRSTKRKSKEYSSAPRCSSAAANNNNGSSSSPCATDVATGIVPPSTPAPCPSSAAMMMSPAAPACSVPMQWPAPALPPSVSLPPGMAVGVPMNPMAVAPGITPPIFPPPPAPGMLSPMQAAAAAAAAGWPVPGMMMPPPMCGMPHALGMPQFPMCGMMPSMCGGLGMAQSLPSQLPALPMHMLMDACASGASNCGMGMPTTCGMVGGCGMDAMQAGCMADCMPSPCSPCSDPSQDAAFSGKSAQDVLALDADDIGYIETLDIQTPSNTAGMGRMMPRCESNQLLPSLEDLIADQPMANATTHHSNAASACNAASTPAAAAAGGSGAAAHHHHTTSSATAMLDPMDLELEALSLGCLGLKRTDSLEDILSRTIEVF